MALGSILRSPVRSLITGALVGSPWPYVNAEARALVAAMTSPPPDLVKVLIDGLITGLKTDGLWDLFDVLWVTALQDSQAARLNWKSPSTFTLGEVSSPTFTAYRGYTGDGVASYLTTGYTPSTNGVNYVRDSATLAAWSRTAGQVASPIIGISTGNTARIIPRNASDNAVFTINNTTSVNRANTDGSGLFSASRTGSAVQQLYRNGATLGAVDTGASTITPNAQFNLLRSGTTAFSSAQIAFAAAGAGLTAGQHANLYTRLNTFMVGVGAA